VYVCPSDLEVVGSPIYLDWIRAKLLQVGFL